MTLTQLRRGIDEYFEHCAENGEFPDYAGMKLSLGLSDSGIEKLCAREKTGRRFAGLFEQAAARRESWLARRAAGGNAGRNCLSLLGRPENGGYEQSVSNPGGIKLVIALEGLGGIESAK